MAGHWYGLVAGAVCAVTILTAERAHAQILLANPDPEPCPALQCYFGDRFGVKVAAGHHRIAIGADRDGYSRTPHADGGLGKVYLYEDTGEFIREIQNPSTTANYFGQAIAFAGSNLLVGTRAGGGAYLFDGATGDLLLSIPNPDSSAANDFGAEVASFATNLIVGAPADDTVAEDSGRVYIFDEFGAAAATIENPNPQANSFFGGHVINSGSDLLITAVGQNVQGHNDAGAVYVIDPSTGIPVLTILNPDPRDGGFFGVSVAATQSLIAVTSLIPNLVYIFDSLSGMLVRTFAPSPYEAFFGSDSAIDDHRLYVATTSTVWDTSSVEVFDIETGISLGTWSEPAPYRNSLFGSSGFGSIALTGSKLVVGAMGDNGGAGNSYIFDFGRCGDGLIDSLRESCDDGGTQDNDGCSAGCEFEPGWNCFGEPTVCEFTACPPARANCSIPTASLLKVSSGGSKKHHRLLWKWEGAATDPNDFADLVNSSEYALCIYSGTTEALVAHAVVPVGPWGSTGHGYKYSDPDAIADGITKISARSDPMMRLLVKGKGADLPDLTLPVVSSLTVQLVNTENGSCWGASYDATALTRNDTRLLKGKLE